MVSETTKKRKREALPEEIEVDVNLPEPPSRKAARRLKKGKPIATTATAKGTDSEDEKPAPAKDDSKPAKRSEHGVWIGNLPWTATKATLREFLVEHSESITDDEITRVNMPAPTNPPSGPPGRPKPQNKGFAYVDFATATAMYAAIALTETLMEGRRLLIKNATSFEGRPAKPKNEDGEGKKDDDHGGKPPNKRIFVGNLGFDVSKDDLREHFEQCGEVADLFMATFEDTGKCKGFAWVTFQEVEAATAAVKGYIYKEEGSSEDEDDEDSESKPKKKKKQKWFVNKLQGRDLRCEFAEDASVRYKKRYGKDKPEGDKRPPIEEVPSTFGGMHPDRFKKHEARPGWKPKQQQNGGRRVDARSIRPGAAHTNAPRASQAIVESKGKKTTFE